MRRDLIELNERLAILLGYTHVEWDEDKHWLYGLKGGVIVKIPDWTGDWKECGHLMSQFVHKLVVGKARIWADPLRMEQQGVIIVNYENRDQAMRVAVVKAAIASLSKKSHK